MTISHVRGDTRVSKRPLRGLRRCAALSIRSNGRGWREAVGIPGRSKPRLILRRLALAEREREVAATRAHVLDTGDLRNHTAAWGEDVEELGVAELVLAIDDVEVAAEPGSS